MSICDDRIHHRHVDDFMTLFNIFITADKGESTTSKIDNKHAHKPEVFVFLH